jgi:hypothetical protein
LSEEVSMKRLVFVAVAAVSLLVALAGPASAVTLTVESFEAGFGQWQPDTDGRAPSSSVTISSAQAFHGIRSVRIFMDGRQDDGTTWVETRFNGPPSTTVRVTVSFQLWSPGQGVAGGWNVVAVAGTGDPEAEADFTRLGPTEVKAGWRPYGAGWTFRTDSTGQFWVALGTSVIWEVQKAHFIDQIRVDLVTTQAT